jgi:antitoxin (DNA-binding transcriptional repressor) of toxin-antitoxin stability system
MKKKNKKYRVNIDMVWSREFVVTAKNKPVAKMVAFAKFQKKMRKADFKVEVREEIKD